MIVWGILYLTVICGFACLWNWDLLCNHGEAWMRWKPHESTSVFRLLKWGWTQWNRFMKRNYSGYSKRDLWKWRNLFTFLCVKGMKEYRYKPRSSRLWSGSRGRKHWNKETRNSTWKLSDVRWSRTSHSFIKVVEYFISYIWKQFNIQFASFL